MTPNFICLGAQKAGTTTLHDILKQHPEIYLPDRKEAHFFDQPERYQKGMEWWINEFFSSYNKEPIMGVITPEYLYYSEVPKRILNNLGSDIKFIIILRHPVDRAYSHYLMSKRRGFENLSFEKSIEMEAARLEQNEFNRNHFSYIDRGHYAIQIERYTDLYPTKNILFLSFEHNIKINLEDTLQRIQIFLGVTPLPLNTSIKSNVASETKSKRVQNIIKNDHFLKRIVKTVIPKKMRSVIKQRMTKINSQSIGEQGRLNKGIRNNLFQRYYANEIAKINKITTLDFGYWDDENDDNT